MRDVKVLDKDFFMSNAFAGYLRTCFSYTCMKFKVRTPTAKIIEDEKVTAYTEGKSMVASYNGPLVKLGKNRPHKVKILMGECVHELGHILFTDFTGTMNAIKSLLLNGMFYPVIKESELDEELLDNMEDAEAYMKCPDDKDEETKRRRRVASLWKTIANIIEDVYIEERLYQNVTGILVDALNETRRIQLETCVPLSKMLPEYDGKTCWPIVHNMMLSYMKYGRLFVDWSNPAEAESEPVKWLIKAKPYMRPLLDEKSTRARLKGFNLVFLALWPMLREFLEAHADDSDEEMSDASSSETGSMGSSDAIGSEKSHTSKPVSGSSDEETGDVKTKSAKAREKTDKKMDKVSKKSSSGKKKRSKDTEPEKEKGEDEEKDESASDEGKEKEPESKDEGSSDTPEPDVKDGSADESEAPGSSDFSTDEGEVEDAEIGDEEHGEADATLSFDPEEFEADMARLERDITEAKAIDAVNEDIERELSNDAASIDYGTAHKGIQTLVLRHTEVPESVISSYEASARPVEQIAKTMAKKVLPYLKKKKGDDMLPMSGFYSGSKFDATRLVMGDMRYFKTSATPLPDTRLAVSVLLDESGSMGWGARMSSARTAALALYLFCQECGIPCSVQGHTAPFNTGNFQGTGHYLREGSLVINSYAEFDTPDKKDKYRIMCARAYEDNRDGAAILYTGTRLLKRPEPTKLMFIICDGAPAASGYYGAAAENDMAMIVANLRRKGVIVFSMAIGSDKENIHRIFGDGFIDINDLSTVPDQLLSMVKRFIR